MEPNAKRIAGQRDIFDHANALLDGRIGVISSVQRIGHRG